MAVGGLTVGLTLLFGYSIFDWEFLNEIKDELAFNAPGVLPLLSTVIYKISVLLVCFLPFVGMLYGGIMMIFDLRSPRWRPGLIIFLLWIIALTVFTVLTFHAGESGRLHDDLWPSLFPEHRIDRLHAGCRKDRPDPDARRPFHQ